MVPKQRNELSLEQMICFGHAFGPEAVQRAKRYADMLRATLLVPKPRSELSVERIDLKNLIEILVKALVDNPDSVVVEEVDEGHSVTYEVKVDPDDMGKVIGKQGRVANALRTVAKAAAIKDRKNVYVRILP